MESQQQEGSSGRTAVACLTLVVRSLAAPLEVIAHRGFGMRYFDLRMGIAALLMFFFPVLFPTCSPIPVWCLLALFLAVVPVRRWESRRLWLRGSTVHSRYSGLPVLCRKYPRMSEMVVKQYVEPAVAFALGVVLGGLLSPPLGCFIVLSATVAFMDVAGFVEQQRRRRMDVQDAVIDAQDLRGVGR